MIDENRPIKESRAIESFIRVSDQPAVLEEPDMESRVAPELRMEGEGHMPALLKRNNAFVNPGGDADAWSGPLGDRCTYEKCVERSVQPGDLDIGLK